MNTPKSESSPKDEEPVKVAHLTVQMSPIKVDGTCRVPETALALIDVEEKEQLAIHFGGESILCTMYADHMMTDGHIKLRTEDMNRIGVKEGDTVVVASLKDMKEYEKDLKEKEKERKKAKKASVTEGNVLSRIMNR